MYQPNLSKRIHILEYRLNNETLHYPVLYSLKDGDAMEFFCRTNCDYFLLDHTVYEQVSTALEETHEAYYHVIYVEEAGNEFPYYNAPIHRPDGIEVRCADKRTEITFVPCDTTTTVFSYLDKKFTYFMRKEYERVSAELDQDRQIYILYVRPTGVEI